MGLLVLPRRRAAWTGRAQIAAIMWVIGAFRGTQYGDDPTLRALKFSAWGEATARHVITAGEGIG